MKRAREERKAHTRWLNRLEPKDLAHCPDSTLRKAIKVLQDEYDRRNRFHLFWWANDYLLYNGVAIRYNDPRYQDEWITAIAAYLEAALGYAPEEEEDLTECQVSEFPMIQQAGEWVDGEPVHLDFLSMPDYPTVADVQGYLESEIMI